MSDPHGDTSPKNTSPEIFDAYYDAEKGAYLVKDADGNWMRISERTLMLRMDMAGVSRIKASKDAKYSAAELMLMKVQNQRHIVYAGPLAGYMSGLHRQGNYKVLVTHSPSLPGPYATSEDCSLWRNFIEGAFDDENVKQSPFVYTWVKTGFLNLRSNLANVAEKHFSPGPAMAIAGPKNSGKSLFIALVARLFGGRIAHPYRYMTGQTSFNRDTLGAELLVIDDEVASMDLRTRRALGNMLKVMLFSGSFSVHGKNRDAFTVYPGWRLIFALNDEIENLHVLPPIDESMQDKIMLLKFFKRALPFPANNPEERAILMGQFEAQLPAFLNWLLYEFEAPAFAVDERTGVKAFKHPDMEEALSEIDPAERFLHLVIEYVFKHSALMEWKGTQEALTKLLQDSCYGAKKLLDYSGAAGSFLGRLAPRYPGMIEKVRESAKSNREWIIRRPKDLPLGDPMDKPVYVG
jgi:hypothetical protein